VYRSHSWVLATLFVGIVCFSAAQNRATISSISAIGSPNSEITSANITHRVQKIGNAMIDMDRYRGWPGVFNSDENDTSTAAITYPSTPPNVGALTGTGTVFNDPVSGIKGARVTDSCFDPSYVETGSSVCPTGYAMSAQANNVFTVSNGGSEDDNWFNVPDWNNPTLRLMFVLSGGSRHYLVGFNPTTLAISRPFSTVTTGCPLNSGNCTKTGGWAIGGGGLQFSRVSPYKIYANGDTSDATTLQLYDFTAQAPSFTSTPTAAVTVEDYNQPNGNCLPTNFGTALWTDDAGVTTNDALFGAAFSSSAYYHSGLDWQALYSYSTVGFYIQPTVNNPSNDTFEIIAVGTSGSSEPNWETSCLTTCVDGTVTWTNRGNSGSLVGQGSAYWVVLYSPTKGCMAVNTMTGAITADLGWSGATGLTCGPLQCTGTFTSPGTFTIHNVKLSVSGQYMVVAVATDVGGTACPPSNPHIWWIGSEGSNIFYCAEGGPPTGTKGSGHWAAGWTHFVNDPASPLNQWYTRSQSRGGSGTPIAANTTPSCTTNTDSHSSWNMTNTMDTAPFGFTRTTNNLLTTGLFPYDQPTCAWQDEIDLAQSPYLPGAPGIVYREALTFNTQYSTSFNAANNIAEFSSDGQFASVGSDWFNTLGNAAGTSASSIPKGPDWKAGAKRAAAYIITPSSDNLGKYSYANDALDCVSDTTEPTWPTSGAVTDGSCLWENVGVASGENGPRTDVFLWRLKAPQTYLYPDDPFPPTH